MVDASVDCSVRSKVEYLDVWVTVCSVFSVVALTVVSEFETEVEAMVVTFGLVYESSPVVVIVWVVVTPEVAVVVVSGIVTV